ncbi:DUF3575 domain-containing protein [Spirosoma pomorum]
MRSIFTLLLTVITHVACSQVIIKTNLLYPIVRGGSLALEAATSEHSSINLYAAFGSDGALAFADAYKFQNLIVEKRFYRKSASVFQGAYLAPYAKYMHRQIYVEGSSSWLVPIRGRDSNGHSLGFGTTVGLQIPNRFIKRTFIDAFLGGGYLFYLDETDAKNPGQSRFGHVDLRTGLSFGYMF